ncbi:MAG: acylphosphatase [Anaerolinea sp.]|nr:acylphosphatase [Anaerolinea sp.]
MASLAIRDRRRIIISGQVQGVAFRLWLTSVAHSLELSGEVQHWEDGRCEVVVQGERSLVKQFIVACKRGPSGATVQSIEVTEEKVDPACIGFHVQR